MKYEIHDKYAAMQEVQDFVTHLPARFGAEGELLFANVLKVFVVKEGSLCSAKWW